MDEEHHDLCRFFAAQQGVHDVALSEIRRGCKRSHWMWFVFPQLAGLGRSATAQHFAIRSLDEARAYLNDALLGERLRTCVEALQDIHGSDPEAIFGAVDAMKLQSSLTLFEAAGGGRLFAAALDRWFEGRRNERTLDLLGKDADNGAL